MMTYEYQINIKNQFENILGSLIQLVFMIIGIVCIELYSDHSLDNFLELNYIFVLMVLIHVSGTFLQHFLYYRVNKYDTLIYYESDDRYIFKHAAKNEKAIDFRGIEIIKIEYNKSYALANKTIKLLPWDDYNHMNIFLADGTRIVITSLMVGGEVRIPSRVDNIVTEKSSFRYIFGPSVKQLMP